MFQLAIWTEEYPTTLSYDGNTMLTDLVGAEMNEAAGYGGNYAGLISLKWKSRLGDA